MAKVYVHTNDMAENILKDYKKNENMKALFVQGLDPIVTLLLPKAHRMEL